MSDQCALSPSDKSTYEDQIVQNVGNAHYSKAQSHHYDVEMKEESSKNQKDGAQKSSEGRSAWHLQDESVDNIKHTFENDEKEFEAQTSLLENDWNRNEVRDAMDEFLKGALSMKETAQKIKNIVGREVTVSDVRMRAYNHSTKMHATNDLPQAETQPMNDEEGEPCNDGNVMEEANSKVFGPGLFEVFRSVRGTMTSLAVKEKKGDLVRLYRRSTSRFTYSYYRCSLCDRYSRKVGGFRPPILKMIAGQLVGETHPPHCPECKPVPLSKLRELQVDRETRQKADEAMMPSFEAWSKGPLRALLEETKRTAKKSNVDFRTVRSGHHRRYHEKSKFHFGRPTAAEGQAATSIAERMEQVLTEFSRPAGAEASKPAKSDEPRIELAPLGEGSPVLKRRRMSSGSLKTFRPGTSEMVETRDADGSRTEDGAYIERLKRRRSGTNKQRDDDAGISTEQPAQYLYKDEYGKSYLMEEVDESRVNGETYPARTETPKSCATNGTGRDGDNTSVDSGSTSKTSKTDGDLFRKKPVVYTDKNGRDVIKETERSFFMVDSDHLLNLFRRCPDCGEMLKTLTLSSVSSMPVITYQCRGECEGNVWVGHSRNFS